VIVSFRTVLRGLACVLVVIVGAMVAKPQAAPPLARAQTQSATVMYRVNDAGTALIPMDALTLRDLKGAPAIWLAPPHKAPAFPSIISTPTGTALAAEFYTGANDNAKNQTIRVIDVRTGKARGRLFHPAIPARIEGISEDGSELSAQTWDFWEPGQPVMYPVRHYVLSAADGHIIRSWNAKEFCCGQNLYDQTHRRLYSLITAHADDPKSASQVPELLAQDLQSNRALGRLSLPDLRAGSWQTKRQVGGYPLVRGWSPGFALSPDGRQIALVDGSSNQLTLIDTATLHIVRSVSLVPRQSLLERLGSWLGLLPQTAEAKGMEGVSLYAWYSPDGRLLYLSGTRGRVTKKGTFAWTQLGLRVLDVDSGTILANRFHGKALVETDMSPDGTSLYVPTPGGKPGLSSAFGCPCMVQRLDARTLATEATRKSLGTSNTWPKFYFLAAPGSR
jgi:DNA-binding beta-propeller fold protein YncE